MPIHFMKTSIRSLFMAFMGLFAIQTSVVAQTGLTSESWNNLSDGNSLIILQQEGISDRIADAAATTTNAQITVPTAAKSGTRLRGTITPVLTDTYTFWVSGNDNVALWLSDDASRFNKKLVAFNLESTGVAEWEKHPSQQSVPIQLTAGQNYYLEAQVMDKDGGGLIEVAWQGQNGRYALELNGATATQSSTHWGRDADQAIDGNTSTPTRTQNLSNSWLQVDFGQDRDINRVVLHNDSKNQNWLSNFRISVLDANDVELVGQDFFTTSGSVGDSMTWDLPSSQPTARKIKVQFLGLNLAGKGILAIAEIEAFGSGLVAGQIDQREIISQSYLNTLAADADDTNDNNLSDAWEVSTGLSTSALPGALLEYGDPDKDGLSNYQEQYLGSDPLTKEALSDGLTRHIWMGINGWPFSKLTINKKFYSYPNAIDHVPGVQSAIGRKGFGSRYRGSIIAPATGDYRFWLCGNGGGAELWLADGSIVAPGTNIPLTDRFGKHRICASYHKNLAKDDFDFSPSQRSALIHLEQGKEYYIEVLHALPGDFNKDYVSVAWQPPGGVRQIIPASTYLSNDPMAGEDGDDDNLPDAWETSVTLDATDNGFTSFNNGEYGDPDGDSITNLHEYQLGTDPKNADSDGDGYSDGDEVYLYGSDPAVSNSIATNYISSLNLLSPDASNTTWQQNADGSITGDERRGWTDWTFTVQAGQEGVYDIRLTGGADGSAVRNTENLPISFHINDSIIGRQTMVCKINPGVTTITQLTPWLNAGTYTLRIENHNVRANVNLRIDSVELYQVGGDDLNGNGLADWIETKFLSENYLVQIPTQSLTSPAFVEGVTSSIALLGMTYSTTSQTPQQLEALRSIDSGFFVNVPLSGSETTTLNVSYSAGAFTTNHNIDWVPTNIQVHDNLTIRQGDALRVTAHDPAFAPDGSFTLTMSQGGPALPGGTYSSNSPIELNFDTAGVYTLNADWTPAGGGAQVSSVLTVNVVSADFGDSFIVQTYNRRTWSISGVDGVLVEADSNIVFAEQGSNGSNRDFLVEAYNASSYNVVARVPETGAIITTGNVHAFDLARASSSADAQIVEIRPDGSSIVRFTIVAENLPLGVQIRLSIGYSGSVFSNGGNIIFLTSTDLSPTGIGVVYVESSLDPPRICHSMRASLIE